MSAALGSWWPPEWVQADWVLRAAWWISGDRVTVGTRCDEFHDPGTALLLLYRAPVVENTLLNLSLVLVVSLPRGSKTPWIQAPAPPPQGVPNKLLKGRLQMSNPLLFYIPFLTRNVSLFGTYRYSSHVLSVNASGSRFGFFHKR